MTSPAASRRALISSTRDWKNGTPTRPAPRACTRRRPAPSLFLERIPPERFVKLLAAGEIAVGSALLAPVVPSALAGAALTGFSGSLLAMYLRTPAMHKPGSVWPTQAGTAVSKDVWMLGIGLGLMAGSVGGGEDEAGAPA